MMDSRRLAYLDAMGIDVWQPRGANAPAGPDPNGPSIVLGPGDGDILCIVHSESESGLKLAAGIGAAMRCQPIWCWPNGETGQVAEPLTLEGAVSEKMLTRILVFGEELAEQLLGADRPEVISAARVHVVPDMDSISKDQEAKRMLWRLMNEHGLAASRSGGK